MLGRSATDLNDEDEPSPVRDEQLAGQCGARLLITAATAPAVETIARRVHSFSRRATFPFVQLRASEFPSEPAMLRATCCSLLEAAAGGCVLVTDVETMRPSVQGRLIELLDELALERAPETIRFVSGTTVALRDRVRAGGFSERLFYRLNILHLIAEGGATAGPSGRRSGSRSRDRFDRHARSRD